MSLGVYLGRRKVKPEVWIASAGFTTYEQLCEWCVNHGVVPPKREDIVDLLPKPAKKKVTTPKPTKEKKAGQKASKDVHKDDMSNKDTSGTSSATKVKPRKMKKDADKDNEDVSATTKLSNATDDKRDK